MAILKSLDIQDDAACDCKAKAIQMDLWGVAGCRKNFNTIVGWMRDGQVCWGWAAKLKAAALAVANGLAFKLDWSDPFPGLVEEAIRASPEGRSPRTTSKWLDLVERLELVANKRKVNNASVL